MEVHIPTEKQETQLLSTTIILFSSQSRHDRATEKDEGITCNKAPQPNSNWGCCGSFFAKHKPKATRVPQQSYFINKY